jgi:hypothetical protein
MARLHASGTVFNDIFGNPKVTVSALLGKILRLHLYNILLLYKLQRVMTDFFDTFLSNRIEHSWMIVMCFRRFYENGKTIAEAGQRSICTGFEQGRGPTRLAYRGRRADRNCGR